MGCLILGGGRGHRECNPAHSNVIIVYILYDRCCTDKMHHCTVPASKPLELITCKDLGCVQRRHTVLSSLLSHLTQQHEPMQEVVSRYHYLPITTNNISSCLQYCSLFPSHKSALGVTATFLSQQIPPMGTWLKERQSCLRCNHNIRALTQKYQGPGGVPV